MPIFEFKCNKCSKKFEALVLSGETPVCPSCGAGSLEKLFSTFASPGREPSGCENAHPSSCSCCSSKKSCPDFG